LHVKPKKLDALSYLLLDTKWCQTVNSELCSTGLYTWDRLLAWQGQGGLNTREPAVTCYPAAKSAGPFFDRCVKEAKKSCEAIKN
jgi:hypothetical protein